MVVVVVVVITDNGGGDGRQCTRQPLYLGSVVVPLSFQSLGPNSPEIINFCGRKFYFGL